MQKRYRKWLWLVLALLVVLGGIGGLVHQRLASTSHKTVKVGDRLTAGLEERGQPVEKRRDHP